MKKLIVFGVLLSGIFIIAGCAVYNTAPTESEIALMRVGKKADIQEIKVSKPEEKVSRLEKRVQDNAERQILTEKQAYVNNLNRLIPDWIEKNKNPKWLEWLSSPAPFSRGKTYQQLLDEANSNMDANGVAEIFNAFFVPSNSNGKKANIQEIKVSKPEEYNSNVNAQYEYSNYDVFDSIDTQYEYSDPYLDSLIDQTTNYQQSSLSNNSSSSIGFVNHYDSQKGYQGFSTINPDFGTVLNYDSKRGYTGFSTINRETGTIHHYDSNRGYQGISTISILGD